MDIHAIAHLGHTTVSFATHLLVQTDGNNLTQDQQQKIAGVVAGMMGVIMLITLAVFAFMIFLYWRILARAGFAGPLAFLTLVPAIGPIIPLCILAFGEWKVAPVPAAPAYYPPQYPPQPPARV